MRTTLDIEKNVLVAAKALARREKKTVGKVISELARKGLTGSIDPAAKEPKEIFGFKPFPKEGRTVNNELIDKLREDFE